jgi:hypothetical protein
MDRMLFGVVGVRGHPVILSDLSRAVPVLDPGFWVVEREGQRRGAATGGVRIATRRAGWRPFAGPTGSLPNGVNVASINADQASTGSPHSGDRGWLLVGRLLRHGPRRSNVRWRSSGLGFGLLSIANAPSSATRPAGRHDCNRSAMAGFAEAPG